MPVNRDDLKAAFEDYKHFLDDLFIETRADIWELDCKVTLLADDLRALSDQLAVLIAEEGD